MQAANVQGHAWPRSWFQIPFTCRESPTSEAVTDAQEQQREHQRLLVAVGLDCILCEHEAVKAIRPPHCTAIARRRRKTTVSRVVRQPLDTFKHTLHAKHCAPVVDDHGSKLERLHGVHGAVTQHLHARHPPHLLVRLQQLCRLGLKPARGGCARSCVHPHHHFRRHGLQCTQQRAVPPHVRSRPPASWRSLRCRTAPWRPQTRQPAP